MVKPLQKSVGQCGKHHRLKVCIAFSSGGHYVEAMQLKEALGDFDICYVAPYAVTTKDLENVHFLVDTTGHRILGPMILNSVISLFILLKEHVDVIITTGAEIFVPLCYLSKLLFGAKIIFIETFARITSPSFTGRVVYPIADVFLVQWKSLLKYYGKKAKYIGTVF